MMKVAKRFRWEGAHRLPWHNGGCQNLHGHSYCMWVELTGNPDENGMLIDFKEIKQVLGKLIDNEWDHAVLVDAKDIDLRKAVDLLGSKHYILPFDTTSENICKYVAIYLANNALALMEAHNIRSVSIRLHETETCYGEYEATIDELKSFDGVVQTWGTQSLRYS